MKTIKQKNISLSPSSYHYLSIAKAHLEQVTHLSMSWGAFLVAISSGALAAQAISGLKLSCPNCEHEMRMTITQLRVVEDEDSEEPSLSSSRAQRGR
ncbi:hypothetical protein ES703_111537 [subsurface metagenome]